MRIALYHNVPSGGAKRAIYEWVRRLGSEHTIDVYSLSTADHEFCDIRPFVHKHNVYSFAPRKRFRSPLGRLNQLQRWRDLGNLDILGRYIALDINLEKYDVVFANTCIFTFIPPLLQYIGIPSVYYLHEPFGPGLVRKYSRPYLKPNPLQKWLNKYDLLIKLFNHKLEKIQKKSAIRTQCLLANSHFTLECMQAEFHIKTIVCPYGVDLTFFKPIPGIQKEDFVVSVGEMSPRKGFDFIIESLGQIPQEKRPPLKLACNTINPEEKEYIQVLAHRLGVELHILTRLNTEELQNLYNQARLCVYAPYMEPFGLVPLEAMACGTPVVGVKEGGVKESVLHEETGLLVERDPEIFSKAILRLLQNPGLTKTFGQNGREYVAQNWTWEQSTKKLESYLMQCAKLL